MTPCNRAYGLMKFWRKLQGSGKLRETDNASTARDIEAEVPPMLTEDDIRGIRTDEQRALGVIDDIGYIRSNISCFINRYQLLRHHYHEHNSSAAKALKSNVM